MDKSTFLNSLLSDEPPVHVSVYLQSLWYEAKGDWEKAHTLIQDINDEKAAHIHAYLHRKEGDLSNADYWYQRARIQRPGISLQSEWENLVDELI